MWRMRIVGILLGFTVWGAASAQHIFLDSDGDGLGGDSEAAVQDTNTVAVWLETDKNADGSRAAVTRGGGSSDLFSYQFVLRATDGTVEWLGYSNAIKSMTYDLGTFTTSTEFSAARGADQLLPAGKYRLGTVTYRVVSGSPSLGFAAESTIRPGLGTSFGSMNRGVDRDHTLKLGIGSNRLSADWTDNNGLRASTIPLSPMAKKAAEEFKYGVMLSPNPANPHATLTIVKSRPGRVSARLFDVSGRLIGTIVSAARLDRGSHAYEVPPLASTQRRLASGIYLIRVDTDEGVNDLRLVILK